MGWNPVKEAEKKAKEAVNKIVEPAVRKLREETIDKIWDLRRQTWDKIKSLGQRVEGEVREAGKDVEREVIGNIRKAGKEIEEGLTDELPDLIEAALSELSKLATKQVYKKAASTVRKIHKELNKFRDDKPNLVGYIDELAFTLEIGPCKLTYGRFYDRAEDLTLVLDRLANEPPEFRRTSIIAMLEATGPDSTDLGISVNVAALVVSSEELGAGFELPAIPLDLVSEITNWVLEEIGVPE